MLIPPLFFNSVTVLTTFNPLNAEFNPIRHLLALVGARHVVHVSRVRVNHVYNHYTSFAFYSIFLVAPRRTRG